MTDPCEALSIEDRFQIDKNEELYSAIATSVIEDLSAVWGIYPQGYPTGFPKQFKRIENPPTSLEGNPEDTPVIYCVWTSAGSEYLQERIVINACNENVGQKKLEYSSLPHPVEYPSSLRDISDDIREYDDIFTVTRRKTVLFRKTIDISSGALERKRPQTIINIDLPSDLGDY